MDQDMRVKPVERFCAQDLLCRIDNGNESP